MKTLFDKLFNKDIKEWSTEQEDRVRKIVYGKTCQEAAADFIKKFFSNLNK